MKMVFVGDVYAADNKSILVMFLALSFKLLVPALNVTAAVALQKAFWLNISFYGFAAAII